MDEISIWARDDDGQVTRVDRIAQVDYENNLEETLIEHPDMLMPSLTLVARQLPTGGGPLDLLGVDADGRLIVFELKRGRLPRDVVTQAIDYASWLDSISFDDLAMRISNHSPEGGIEDIDDFGAWYDERFTDDQRANFQPTKVVLVGLGIDSATERMARWLNAAGVDISAITFQGFNHSGETLLARQVEVSAEEPGRPAVNRRRRAPADPRAVAEEFGVESLFDAAVELLDACFDGLPAYQIRRQGGLTYDLRQIDGPSGNAYAGVFVDRQQRALFLAVHDIARNLAQESFGLLDQQLKTLGLKRERGDVRTKYFATSLEQLRAAGEAVAAFYADALREWEKQRANAEDASRC